MVNLWSYVEVICLLYFIPWVINRPWRRRATWIYYFIFFNLPKLYLFSSQIPEGPFSINYYRKEIFGKQQIRLSVFQPPPKEMLGFCSVQKLKLYGNFNAMKKMYETKKKEQIKDFSVTFMTSQKVHFSHFLNSGENKLFSSFLGRLLKTKGQSRS